MPIDDEAKKIRDELLQNQKTKSESTTEEWSKGLLELYKDEVDVSFYESPQIETDDELKNVVELLHHLLLSNEVKKAEEIYENLFGTHEQDTFLNMRVLTELVDKLPTPNLMNTLGIAYADAGHPLEAKQLFETCLQSVLVVDASTTPKQYSLKGDEFFTAVLLGNLAEAEFNLGWLASARERLDVQILICQELKFPDKETKNLYKRFSAAKRSGIAPLISNPGLERMERFENRLGTALYQISRLYIYTGEYDRAISYANTAAMIKDVRTEWGGCHIATMYLALGLAKIGEIQKAKETSDFSFKCATESHISRNVARANLARAKIYIRNGDLAEATIFLQDALSISRGQFIDVECDVLLAFAELHFAKNELVECYSSATEALSIATRCRYQLKQADCHLILAKLAHEQKDYEKKSKHAKLAYEYAKCDGDPNVYKAVLEESKSYINS